jgi:predicted LPLAT superfamily acyltransferase
MASHWSEQSERTNQFWLMAMAWSAIYLGRGFLQLLCVPIALFFLLTASQARRDSQRYLARVLGRPPVLMDTFKHFYTFALVSGDRLLFLAGRSHLFQLDVHGEKLLTRYADQQQGCLLLVSHLGSFDAMRVRGVEDVDIPVRILIDKLHNQAAIRVVETLNPALAKGMIDAAKPSVDLVLQLDECLKAGEMVGIMADRAAINEKVEPIEFLGDKAGFPVGPWRLAAVLKVPVLICFAVYQGKNRYSVYIEEVSSGQPVPRSDRQRVSRENMAQYVSRLEFYTRSQPYNWFNFYNFWLHETVNNN